MHSFKYINIVKWFCFIKRKRSQLYAIGTCILYATTLKLKYYHNKLIYSILPKRDTVFCVCKVGYLNLTAQIRIAMIII